MYYCKRCEETKSAEHFYFKKPEKEGGKSYARYICKECSKDEIKERRHHINGIIKRHKALRGCKVCGDKRWWVLEYHHPKYKKENMSKLVAHAAINRIREEIKICWVVCANCHRNIHYKDRIPSNLIKYPPLLTH